MDCVHVFCMFEFSPFFVSRSVPQPFAVPRLYLIYGEPKYCNVRGMALSNHLRRCHPEREQQVG